jgi:flagellin-like hook-associated protein FlgL
MPLLKSASEHMNRELGFYGAAQNRIDAAMTDTKRLQVQWQADLAKVKDANTVQAITDLTTASTHQQIALSARANMPQSTLFDYLG